MSDGGQVHACAVNGHDAQYWFEQAEAWKAKAGSAGSDGEHRERRRWQKATGFEFASWYERAHPKAAIPDEAANPDPGGRPERRRLLPGDPAMARKPGRDLVDLALYEDDPEYRAMIDAKYGQS